MTREAANQADDEDDDGRKCSKQQEQPFSAYYILLEYKRHSDVRNISTLTYLEDVQLAVQLEGAETIAALGAAIRVDQ